MPKAFRNPPNDQNDRSAPPGAERRSGLRRFLPVLLPAVILLGWWLVTSSGAVPRFCSPDREQWPSGFYRFSIPANSSRMRRSPWAACLRAFCFQLRPPWGSHFYSIDVRFGRVRFHFVLEALRVIPPLSLVPLLILWLGIDEAPKLAIVVLASFFPIYLSALTACEASAAI